MALPPILRKAIPPRIQLLPTFDITPTTVMEFNRPSTSALMDLPVELFRMIVAHAMPEAPTTLNANFVPAKPDQSCSNLLLTSGAFYTETSNLLYRHSELTLALDSKHRERDHALSPVRQYVKGAGIHPQIRVPFHFFRRIHIEIAYREDSINYRHTMKTLQSALTPIFPKISSSEIALRITFSSPTDPSIPFCAFPEGWSASSLYSMIQRLSFIHTATNLPLWYFLTLPQLAILHQHLPISTILSDLNELFTWAFNKQSDDMTSRILQLSQTYADDRLGTTTSAPRAIVTNLHLSDPPRSNCSADTIEIIPLHHPSDPSLTNLTTKIHSMSTSFSILDLTLENHIHFTSALRLRRSVGRLRAQLNSLQAEVDQLASVRPNGSIKYFWPLGLSTLLSQVEAWNKDYESAMDVVQTRIREGYSHDLVSKVEQKKKLYGGTAN